MRCFEADVEGPSVLRLEDIPILGGELYTSLRIFYNSSHFLKLLVLHEWTFRKRGILCSPVKTEMKFLERKETMKILACAQFRQYSADRRLINALDVLFLSFMVLL